MVDGTGPEGRVPISRGPARIPELFKRRAGLKPAPAGHNKVTAKAGIQATNFYGSALFTFSNSLPPTMEEIVPSRSTASYQTAM